MKDWIRVGLEGGDQRIHGRGEGGIRERIKGEFAHLVMEPPEVIIVCLSPAVSTKTSPILPTLLDAAALQPAEDPHIMTEPQNRPITQNKWFLRPVGILKPDRKPEDTACLLSFYKVFSGNMPCP